MPAEPDAAAVPASPAASGPTGALFESQVAAHYLLTLLAEADPRGLPGTLIGRVALQRAGEGHPLDDVIVYGTGRDGLDRTIEIQVKRTITFAPGDSVFRDVVHQLATAMAALDRSHARLSSPSQLIGPPPRSPVPTRTCCAGRGNSKRRRSSRTG